MTKKGICDNFGNCPSKADQHVVIEIESDKEFVCPDCGNRLIPLDEWESRKKKRSLIPFPFILLVLTGVILAGIAFSFFKNSSFVKKKAGLSSSLQPKLLFSITTEDCLAQSLVRPLVLGFLHEDLKGKEIGWREQNPQSTELSFLLPDKTQALINIQTQKTTDGFDHLVSAKNELLISCRKIQAEELKRFPFDMTAPDHEIVIGQSAIAVLVNKQNPLNSLSLEQLEKIFAGNITHWKELNLPYQGKIILFVPDQRSSCSNQTLSSFFRHLPVDGARIKAVGVEEVKKAVLENPTSLGIADYPSVSEISGANGNVKILSLFMKGAEAFKPNRFTIGTEEYPLAFRLYLYVTDKNSSWIHKFIHYVLSTQGQKCVSSLGFVGSGIEEASSGSIPTKGADEGNIIPLNASERYKSLVTGAKRVPFDIRFRFGSKELDNKGIVDIKRLAQFLLEPANKDKGVLLIGFTDNVGNHTYNLGLSFERAQSVANALKKEGITVVNVAGAGEEMPVASNDTEAGREKNRRVEVWLCAKK
ncbi:membrane protein [Methylacidiphilum kamchatkense Kam1]|uniref:Membrane protein n=1 Tax=Methylacidiphilum kamchatkense Kam1 TaxID=1202785 RepID=A0A0C1USR9_9BACT|nr:phosphate ABC transporter substrate-binding/OmpA family protein [Methylacidiphilum kamchatkense]KIE59314.1 membrane protein [Methylacidiphilum kamchatkense Kam1]QDQ42719.1 phosphate ABC transporter substrate-binding protein (PhoT family) [Methylacidiphilum kamchatkense Kam1]